MGKFDYRKYKNYNETVYDKEYPLHSRPFGDTPFAKVFWDNLKRERNERGSGKIFPKTERGKNE
jgi:hypothetical protein